MTCWDIVELGVINVKGWERRGIFSVFGWIKFLYECSYSSAAWLSLCICTHVYDFITPQLIYT